MEATWRLQIKTVSQSGIAPLGCVVFVSTTSCDLLVQVHCTFPFCVKHYYFQFRE